MLGLDTVEVLALLVAAFLDEFGVWAKTSDEIMPVIRRILIIITNFFIFLGFLCDKRYLKDCLGLLLFNAL